MSDKKRALIKGITSKDGGCLEEFLLKKGYDAHGVQRRSYCFNTVRINHYYKELQVTSINLIMHFGNLTVRNLAKIIKQVIPYEIYNLGVQILKDNSCFSKNEFIPKGREFVFLIDHTQISKEPIQKTEFFLSKRKKSYGIQLAELIESNIKTNELSLIKMFSILFFIK